MDNDTAIVLLIADMQREIQAQRAENQALRQTVEALQEGNASLQEQVESFNAVAREKLEDEEREATAPTPIKRKTPQDRKAPHTHEPVE